MGFLIVAAAQAKVAAEGGLAAGAEMQADGMATGQLAVAPGAVVALDLAPVSQADDCPAQTGAVFQQRLMATADGFGTLQPGKGRIVGEEQDQLAATNVDLPTQLFAGLPELLEQASDGFPAAALKLMQVVDMNTANSHAPVRSRLYGTRRAPGRLY